jgi:hypothetical protein
MPLKFLELADYVVKKTAVLNMHQPIRNLMQKWLRECGMRCDDDFWGAHHVQIPNQDGSVLLEQHINVAWKYMEWGLQLKGAECVPPDLLSTFMKCLLEGPPEDADAEFIQNMEKAQAERKKLLMKMLEAKLCLVPVYCCNHWTLVVVKNTPEGIQIKYRDSLSKACRVCKLYAGRAVKELVGLEMPDRCNAAMQEPGSGMCGTYVLQWMEMECRSACLNEVWSSAGWPKPHVWGDRVYNLMSMMQKEEHKAIEEAQKETDKVQALHQKARKKKEKKNRGCLTLKISEEEPCFENLSSEAQLEVTRVRAIGVGSCSRCRWSTLGCLSCSGLKVMNHLFRLQSFKSD